MNIEHIEETFKELQAALDTAPPTEQQQKHLAVLGLKLVEQIVLDIHSIADAARHSHGVA